MAEMNYQQEGRPVVYAGINWSAIWAGLFTFIGIWSVFGLLGFVIFTHRMNNGLATSTNTSNIGLGIWAIILSGIAMYVAGRETGRLAGLNGRYESLVHGMVMFGLALTAAVVLTISGRSLLVGFPSTTVSIPYITGAFGASGWLAFVALFVGWLFAILGAVSGAMMRKPALPSNVRDMRPAA